MRLWTLLSFVFVVGTHGSTTTNTEELQLQNIVFVNQILPTTASTASTSFTTNITPILSTTSTTATPPPTTPPPTIVCTDVTGVTVCLSISIHYSPLPTEKPDSFELSSSFSSAQQKITVHNSILSWVFSSGGSNKSYLFRWKETKFKFQFCDQKVAFACAGSVITTDQNSSMILTVTVSSRE